MVWGIRFVFVIFGVLRTVEAAAPNCDPSEAAVYTQGNLGETSRFPWLGILRVHLHEEGSLKIALSGVVYIKTGYAIANAADVAKIPKRIFQHDSKVQFIVSDNETWFCKPKDYLTHPEYEYSTMNTVALIELDPEEDSMFPMKPICWPPYSFNTSNEIYAIGYTDENQLLEKSIHKLQYVDLQTCNEFYNRAGLTEHMLTPQHYECGFAANNTESCVWDNGMAIASNATGYWSLIGLSIHGPACAAPARFISMQPYFQWVESATDAQELDDYLDFRKSAFNKGFSKATRHGTVDIPVHTMGASSLLQKLDQNYSYPFDTEAQMSKYFKIDKIDDDAFDIQRVYDQTGNCTHPSNNLIYNEDVKIDSSKNDAEQATYKLSLYDLHYLNYSCVKIRVKSALPATAKVYFKTMLDFKEGTGTKTLGDTPEEILKIFPIQAVTWRPYNENDYQGFWKPPHLRPMFISDPANVEAIKNINIFIQIVYVKQGKFGISIYGPERSIFEKDQDETEQQTTSTEVSTQAVAYSYKKRIVVYDNVKAEVNVSADDVPMYEDVIEVTTGYYETSTQNTEGETNKFGDGPVAPFSKKNPPKGIGRSLVYTPPLNNMNFDGELDVKLNHGTQIDYSLVHFSYIIYFIRYLTFSLCP